MSQGAVRPTVLRRDAARNRRRILDAARSLADDGKPLQLNLVAQHAGVGVATVYRHFPTSEALTEALAAEQISILISKVESVPQTVQGLRCFIKTALAVFMRDSAPATALIDPVTDDVRTQRRRLLYGLRSLVTGIVASDPSLSPTLGPMPCCCCAERAPPSVTRRIEATRHSPTATCERCSSACFPGGPETAWRSASLGRKQDQSPCGRGPDTSADGAQRVEGQFLQVAVAVDGHDQVGLGQQ